MKTSHKHKGHMTHTTPDEHEYTKESESYHEQATHTKKDKKLPGKLFALISGIIIVLIIAIVIVMLARQSDNGVVSNDKIKIELYVMSQCPYGTQVENAIYPVLQKMGDAVDFRLDFIVQETAPGSGTFKSLHGEKEVNGNIVQLCVKKYYPDDYKYMNFIICQNKDAANVDTNWEACAEENDMNANTLRACLEGAEGKSLLRESEQNAKFRNARASPTIYVNDEPYQGQRDSLSFQRAICKFAEHTECENLPICTADKECTEEKGMIGVCNNPGTADAYCTYVEPVSVEYIVLNAGDCKGAVCDPTKIIQATQQIFLGAKPKIVDVYGAEGKAIIEKYGIEKIPAFLFASNVVETRTWKERADIQTAFDKVGDKYKLKDEVTGATYNPFAEICDNGIDDNGDGKIDCEDEDCKEEWICMEKKEKPELELFVMSHCPYGTQIEKGILPVVELLGDKIDFQIKFCDYAMHSKKELDEQLRQYCIQKEQNDKFLDYLRCFLEEGDSEGCLSETGIDKTKLDSCIAVTDTEFKVTENFEDKSTWKGNFPTFNIHKIEVDKYGVRGSPALIINGVTARTSRDPANLLKAICYGFKDKPEECSGELSSQVPSPGFGFLAIESAPQGQC